MCSVEKLIGLFSDVMNEAPIGDIGLAVSGGGDSLALLYLSADWAIKNGRRVKSATVDHGLRSESQSECAYVKELSGELLIEHTTLNWLENPSGNMQKSARDARHRLLTQWATENNLSVVLLGHTLEDNAETIMIRLIRGSGIDGLTGISKSIKINNLAIFRPLLEISRENLRNYLTFKNVTWIDEPSNLDERFQRVKIRKLFPQLLDLGLTPSKLVGIAQHMARAKEAINSEVLGFARNSVKQKAWGDLEIDQEAFMELSAEYQFRLLSAALRWISGNVYRPRLRSLKMLLNSLIEPEKFSGFSLMGCIIKCRRGTIVLTREFSALPKQQTIQKTEFIWDKKWNVKVDPCTVSLLMIGPLGQNGLAQIKMENRGSIPFNALKTSVALFKKDQVHCVPMLSYGSGLSVELVGGPASFLNFLATY